MRLKSFELLYTLEKQEWNWLCVNLSGLSLIFILLFSNINYPVVVWLEGHLIHFPSQSQKKQKNWHRENFLVFPEMELSSCNIKKCLYFLSEKGFLYFVKRKPSLYFPKRKHFFIPRNRTLHFSANTWKIKTFRPRKQKWSFLSFGKWNFWAPSLVSFWYFRRELAKSEIHILRKVLEDNSFYLFYKLNQSILLIEPSFGILLLLKFVLIFSL